MNRLKNSKSKKNHKKYWPTYKQRFNKINNRTKFNKMRLNSLMSFIKPKKKSN